jgi:hypothetical protein
LRFRTTIVLARFRAATVATIEQLHDQHTLPITGTIDPTTTAAVDAAVYGQFPSKYSVSLRVYSVLSASVGGLNIPRTNESIR